ncbi:hypothetical protein HRI_002328700 [Hibiscus trionum]|uniref:Uncharacterized protein n=1 Tax=Hibiscus trionum TaxID=183268 RepID=A0A9W7HY28_HIBTR|nr:hypothetical protein HRI_002328700 [Hibiscus trionum]
MGFSESRHGCRRHPDHQGKQGVCPSCLSEKLSRLYSYKESDFRVVAEKNPRASSSFRVSTSAGSNGFKKSKSLAFVQRNYSGEEEFGNGKKEKKGFWSKLLGFKGKNKDFLKHSSSTRFYC